MRLHAILPGQLYQSAYTVKTPLEELRRIVGNYRLTMIVNLWSAPDLRLQPLVSRYRHRQLPDGRVTQQVAMQAVGIADEIIAELHEGGKVLVHCRGGRNRAGLVSALVLKRKLGMTGEEAVAAVQAARPRALANDHFVCYLITGELS